MVESLKSFKFGVLVNGWLGLEVCLLKHDVEGDVRMVHLLYGESSGVGNGVEKRGSGVEARVEPTRVSGRVSEARDRRGALAYATNTAGGKDAAHASVGRR
ncbi:hypothetical protein Tco_0347752 [Tanacetum coccineum]